MATDNEEYQKAVEAVGLKNWTRIPPSERTSEELAEFVRVEPTEHIVGPQYTNGVNLVGEIYAEIADRLVRLTEENELLKREVTAKDEQYIKCREELAATRERRDECEAKMFKAFDRVTCAEQKLTAKNAELRDHLEAATSYACAICGNRSAIGCVTCSVFKARKALKRN